MRDDRPLILLVDDDRLLAETLCRVLPRFGYRVEWFAGASSTAAELVSTPSVALLDLKLGDGNGVELAQTLRARFPALPMLLMTGTPFGDPRELNTTGIFRQVFRKPLDLRQLREALSIALSENAHAHAAQVCPC